MRFLVAFMLTWLIGGSIAAVFLPPAATRDASRRTGEQRTPRVARRRGESLREAHFFDVVLQFCAQGDEQVRELARTFSVFAVLVVVRIDVEFPGASTDEALVLELEILLQPDFVDRIGEEQDFDAPYAIAKFIKYLS